MRTIPEIITAAGGARRLGKLLGVPAGVYRFRETGIADKYWPALLSIIPGLTIEEIYFANRAARGEPAVWDPAPDRAETILTSGSESLINGNQTEE